jgi:hypothetical protein
MAREHVVEVDASERRGAGQARASPPITTVRERGTDPSRLVAAALVVLDPDNGSTIRRPGS